MKKIYILFLLPMVFAITSCEDFLGNKPKGFSIPKYYEDYYLLMQGGTLVDDADAGCLWSFTDNINMTNEGEIPPFLLFSSQGDDVKNLYQFKSGPVYPAGADDTFWKYSYNKIYVCNVVANNIYNVPDATQEEKDALWAEAVTHRAYHYFKLVNLYAPHYNAATAANDYAIPLLTNEKITYDYSLSTVQQVYDLILEEVGKAIEFLPAEPKNKYHPCKASAYALLAKTCLYMQNFADALKYADLAEANNSASFVDMTAYQVDEFNPFARLADANGVPYPENKVNPEVIWAKNFFAPMGSVFVSEEFYSLYGKDIPEDAQDARKMLFAEDKAWFFMDYIFPGKVLYMGGGNSTGGIELQDILLMVAECEVRVNGSKGIERALKCLDRIRDSRIEGNQPLVAETPEKALELVLDERRREMIEIPTERWFDLKRLNMEPAHAKTIVHELDGQFFELPANDLRYVMPLPPQVLNFRPDLPQYER